MAIDFPDSPKANDTHAYNGRTWKYDGTDWVEITPEPAE